MSFKSENFYLENIQDKSFIGSNSNSTANSISSGTGSRDFTYIPHFDYPIAIDTTTVAVGHYNNVRLYYMIGLFMYSDYTQTITIPRVANSIAIDSDFVFIGSSSSNVVYKYDKRGVEYPAITSVRANSVSSFGKRIKARDGLLVVSAPNNYSNVGSVHVFDYKGMELAILKPNNSNQYTGFGMSIGLGDNIIAVGAPYDREGKVYLYDYSYNLKKVLAGPNMASQFGYSVAAGFSSVIVGAPNVTSKGGAYIYNSNGEEIRYIDAPQLFGSSYSVGRYVGIEAAKGILFLPSAIGPSSTTSIAAFDLRGNSYSGMAEFGSPANHYYGNSTLVTSNGNVFVGSDITFTTYKSIRTFSLEKRKHILEVNP